MPYCLLLIFAAVTADSRSALALISSSTGGLHGFKILILKGSRGDLKKFIRSLKRTLR